MRHGQQLQTIDKHRFFEFIGHAQLVTIILFLQLIVADTNVLSRIGFIVLAWLFEIAHLTGAHEVGGELKVLAIPRIQIRTRRRFAIEFRNIQGDEAVLRNRRELSLGLHNSRRPENAHSIGFIALA